MKLQTKLNHINRHRSALSVSIDSLVSEISEIAGIDLISNDFAGDGLGIGLSEDDELEINGYVAQTYMPIEDVLAIIKETGTFKITNLTRSL